jgi:UDP-2,3-diacylglucosamine pyrophosphatase LpxH
MRSPDFLSVSDLHLGFWEERNTAYTATEKAEAFRAIITYGKRHQVRELFLNGDTFDERKPAPEHWRRDAGFVQEALTGFGGEVRVLGGNHDEDLGARDFRQRLGPCDVPGSTVLLHPGDVLITHGHVLETNRIWELMRQLEEGGPASIERLLRGDAELRREMRALDQFNKWTEYYEPMSDAGRRSGERAVNMFRRLRERIAGVVRRLPLPGNATRRAARAVATPTVEAAAHLGAVRHSWGAVFGHTHFPGIFRRDVPDPRTGRLRPVIVGNSGSFIHQDEPLSCLHVEPDARRMTLLGYDRGQDAMVPLESMAAESEVPIV